MRSRQSRDLKIIHGIILLLCFSAFLLSCNREFTDEEAGLDDTIRFFTIGDWGRGGMPGQRDLAAAMEQLASKHRVDFVLSLGDNFYPDGVTSVTDPQWKTSFEEVYTGALEKIIWYVALGNHDYHQNPQAEIEYSKTSNRWRMPSSFYTVQLKLRNKGSVRLVVLDTSPFERQYYPGGYSGKFIDSTRQKVWIDSVLSLQDADWTIAAAHHPIYTGGARINDPNSVRDILLPLFTKHKLPAYFAGHEHDLQHLKSPDFPTHQFVSGAGSELRPTGALPITRFSASVNGFMSVEITRKDMRVFVISHELDTIYSTQLRK